MKETLTFMSRQSLKCLVLTPETTYSGYVTMVTPANITSCPLSQSFSERERQHRHSSQNSLFLLFLFVDMWLSIDSNASGREEDNTIKQRLWGNSWSLRGRIQSGRCDTIDHLFEGKKDQLRWAPCVLRTRVSLRLRSTGYVTNSVRSNWWAACA